jgi:hypothetical protein
LEAVEFGHFAAGMLPVQPVPRLFGPLQDEQPGVLPRHWVFIQTLGHWYPAPPIVDLPAPKQLADRDLGVWRERKTGLPSRNVHNRRRLRIGRNMPLRFLLLPARQC